MRFDFDPERNGGHNYRDGLRFAIYASDRAGAEYMLVDAHVQPVWPLARQTSYSFALGRSQPQGGGRTPRLWR